jgi:hypothetical protein
VQLVSEGTQQSLLTIHGRCQGDQGASVVGGEANHRVGEPRGGAAELKRVVAQERRRDRELVDGDLSLPGLPSSMRTLGYALWVSAGRRQVSCLQNLLCKPWMAARLKLD